MYLRITRGRFDPAQFDDLVPVTQEINAVVHGLPGCQGLYQGIDRTTGALVAVSIWDTDEHARFSRDVLGDRVTRLQALGAQLEPPEIYELYA